MKDQLKAVRSELLGQERFKKALGNPRALELAGTDRYPRFYGDNETGEHLAIMVKYTDTRNARRYRFWGTMSPKELESVMNPPDGFHYWVAQVGLLPNRDPWWMALYDMVALRAAWLDDPDVIERYTYGEGVFYRVNPSTLPGEAKPLAIDMQTLELGLPTDVDERLELAASIAAYRPGEILTFRGTLMRHNKGNTTFLFPSNKGGVEWAIVDSVVPVNVEHE